MIHTDDINRLLVEIVTGKPPAVPDDAELAAMRAQLQKECDEIKARGGEIEIPFEVPDL